MAEFKPGDFVAVFHPGKAGKYFKVVEQTDPKSVKAIDLGGVWASKGGNVYVPVSDCRKVSEADTKTKVVKVDLNPSKYKDVNEKMRIIGGIWRDLEGSGFKVVRTNEADFAFECAVGDREVVQKKFPSSYFTVSNSVAMNALSARNSKQGFATKDKSGKWWFAPMESFYSENPYYTGPYDSLEFLKKDAKAAFDTDIVKVKNSISYNTKFKVGDKVTPVSGVYKGRSFEVTEVSAPDKYQCALSNDPSAGLWTFYDKDIEMTKNAVARNAVGADNKPIKVGDKVEWIDNGTHTGTVTLVDYNRIVVDGKYNVDAMDIYHEGNNPFKNSVARNSVVRNASVPSDWKVVKEGWDSWYGRYVALVQSKTDPSRWTYFADGELSKPMSKQEAEISFKELTTKTYNSVIRNALGVSANAQFKVGDLIKWRDRNGDVNSAYFYKDNGNTVTVSIDKNPSYGGLEIPKEWIIQNSVTRNDLAMNWNYKNSYKFFCVDPSMKAPCILSGWDFREDAQDDAQELKELHIPYKIVSRVTLERAGIDPNAESSWSKNRR